MTEKETKKKYISAYKSITGQKLHNAFKIIKELLTQADKTECNNLFEKYLQTYSFLLEYSAKGVADPQRPEIFRKLQTDLLDLLERVKNEILIKVSQNKLYAQKRIIQPNILKYNRSVHSLLNELISIKESESPERKETLNKLFEFLMFCNTFTTEDKELLRKYSKSNKLKAHEKSVIISAITVSLLHWFNPKKVHSLFDFYQNSEQLARNRALVGIVLVFFRYSERIKLYTKINERAKLMLENEELKSHIETILVQLTKSKETKEISEKLIDDIIPEVAKFKPKIADKLDLDKILSDKLIEDANPDWEEIFDEAPDLLNKMQQYSEMQLDGTDVFMSAFSKLKNFPFFSKPINWFMPFYKENSEILSSPLAPQDELSQSAGEGLEHSMFMCNSDKYSFYYNLNMAPPAQKKMIVELFKAEISQLKDIDKEDKLLNKGNDNKYIFTRYIQDLYRFFNLHPWREDFYNIFAGKLDVYNNPIVRSLDNYNDILLTLGELNFSKKYFNDACDIFLQADVKKGNTQKIYEKIAFSFQKQKDYKNALKYYQYAEFLEEDSVWLQKKIAFCHRKLGDFDKAITYYRKAEEKEPENLHIQANIARSYLFSENYQEAFKHYQKVEYFDSDNIKVMRPLAWCAFALSKFDTADRYYKKLMDIESNSYDYVNYAHLLLVKNDREKAIEFYKKGLKDLGEEEFTEVIEEDRAILINHKIDNMEIDLLQDYLKMQL